MKKIILFILLSTISYAQINTPNYYWVYKYKLKLGTRDSSVTIWFDRTTNKLKLIRNNVSPIDTFNFSYEGISSGGWAISGTTPAKIYQNAGLKIHIRNVSSDTSGIALFNVYGTSYFKDIPTFLKDSIRINSLYYDFPATRVANSILYDSLGNGILKWKPYISNTIDTTKISYLAKNETFTGVKTISNMLSFGASSYLYLPVADATGAAGYFWRSTNVLKYTNSSGDVKTLVAGSGTANQIPYWSDANNLSTLSTATYPSLTELSYVKGVTSAIQTQIGGKQATLVSGTNIKTINSTTLLGSGDIAIPSINGTGFVKASGTTLSYDNSTYTTTNTTQTISGEKTFSASTGVFTTKLAGYNSSSLTSDINFIDFNGSTSTSGVDITGVKSVVSTSLNPTANQLYGGYFTATGSGTSGGTRSYGIYAEASGSGENYAGYFAGNIYTTGTVTGTFSGNLTGNASTVTNGVYTSGSYSNPSWLTSLDASKITQSSSYRFATDAEKTNWNTAYTNNHTHSNKAKLDSIIIAASRINSIPSSYITLSADNEWTGYNRFIKNLLTSDTTGLYINSYTATSGADIKGITSYVYTSSNPTANKIYGGYFRAQGSGTSGGTYSYGIYAEATGSNTNYAGSFVGNVKIDGSIEYTGDKINPFEDLGTSGGAINTAGKTNMKFTYYVSITITSFNDGTDGKEITIYNDGTSGATVTINETGNIITPGSSIVLGQYDNATFKYISTGSTSKWICTSYVDN